jgi:succinoglycan biosynthesis transport protein ExoP
MAETQVEIKSSPLLQIQHYWHVIAKWKWTIFFFFIAVVLIATVLSFVIPPVYIASGSIWIEEEPRILPFEDVQRFDSSSYLSSHSQLLLSRALAADTIDRLKLYENKDFVANDKRQNPLPDASDPVFREELIKMFLKRVAVEPVQGTRLVQVSFSAHSPHLAQDVLNALFTGYIEMIVRQKYRATEQATEFLNTQIASVRAEIQAAEKKLNEYGSEKNILPLTAAETPAVTRLADVNHSLTEATIDRIKKYDYYGQIKTATLGDIPEALNNPLIQRLREKYATLSGDYARRLATIKPEYPEMQRLKSELDATRESLQNETNNLISAAYSDYQTALAKERSLKKLFDEQQEEAFKNNSSAIAYSSLKIDIDNKKTLLESLLRRQSETDVSSKLKGLEAVNVWIVDKANLPLRPAFPNKKRNILIGILLGVVGGIGLALFIEYVNHSVRTSKDVARATGLSTLGVIPAFDAERNPKGPRSEFSRIGSILWGRTHEHERRPKNKKGDVLVNQGPPAADESLKKGKIELISSREPKSIQAESYRSIRTTLLVSSPPGKIKAILVTSPLAREGKSSTVSNLGITLAQANKRVVVVDADLRKPKQNRIFSLNGGWGLTHYVSSFIDTIDLVRPTQFTNLFLVNSGPVPTNPIELLTSEKMDHLVAYMKRSFDYILIDVPPLLAVSDALAMGPLIDGVILVTRAGQTPIQALKQAKQKLDAHKLRCIGVIINGVNLIEQDGYYAKQYYQYAKPE